MKSANPSSVRGECWQPWLPGMTPVKRHRMVNAILQKEFDDGLHALQLSTKTPAEYEKANAK